MKKPQLRLFLIGFSFFACNSEKSPINKLSNLTEDFPTTEKLEFKSFNKYNILTDGQYMIDDSILWYFSNDANNIGSCYDLNTGEQLSTIAMKGNAANEFSNIEFYGSKITNDSIQILTYPNTIKTFAKKDIVENKPMYERGFSVTTIPDSINAGRIVKLPNGSVVATIRGTLGGNPLPEIFNINNKSVAIINDNEVKSYETINYDSFDIKLSASALEDITPNYVIKNGYAYGIIETKGNDIAVFSVVYQFILYTLDLTTGNILKEKKYTNMLSSDTSSKTTNDMEIRMGHMKSNNKYIFCPAFSYFSKEDKEANLKKRALFIFDWNLNPIKKFDLPNIDKCFYILSNDCSAIYAATFIDDDGLTLSKADLKI